MQLEQRCTPIGNLAEHCDEEYGIEAPVLVGQRGTIPYRLRIIEKQRTLRDVELRTSKATAATYVNLSDRVPSKFERMTIAIPGGLHEIAIQLIRPAHGAAEIHARIPQPSVGNEE